MICAVTPFTYGSLQNNFESKQKSKKLEWHEIRHLIDKIFVTFEKLFYSIVA